MWMEHPAPKNSSADAAEFFDPPSRGGWKNAPVLVTQSSNAPGGAPALPGVDPGPSPGPESHKASRIAGDLGRLRGYVNFGARLLL